MSGPNQKSFFDTFGFLIVRAALSSDVHWILHEFENAWINLPDVEHDGTKRTIYPRLFISSSASLSNLLAHPEIVKLCDTLLGPGWSLTGGDGALYTGDTGWHADCGDSHWSPKTLCRHLKIAIYLDRLTGQTGALRVIPGSHHFGDRFFEAIQCLVADRANGLAFNEVPSQVLEVEPGDLVVFDHRLQHASFGGGRRRRMFSMSMFEDPITHAQRDAVVHTLRFYRDIEGLDWHFDKEWIASLNPNAYQRISTTLALGAIARNSI